MRSPFDQIYKFLNLEISRGFDNKAVVGGLGKINNIWLQVSQEQKVDPNTIQRFSELISDYENLEVDSRKQRMRELLGMLKKCHHVSKQNDPQRLNQVNNKDSSTQSQRKVEKSKENLPKRDREGASRPFPKENFPARQVNLDAPLTVISGVGEENAKKLHLLGLYKLIDILYFFPRRYDDYSKLTPINRVQLSDELTIIGIVQFIEERPTRNKQMRITEAVIGDGTGFLRLTWFNRPYLVSHFPVGTQVVVSGKVSEFLGRLSMTNPEIENLEKEHLHTNRIVPVYPLTAQITQRWLRNIMFKSVSYWASRIPDYLPEFIRQEENLIDLNRALGQAHFPSSFENLQASQQRIAFDEIFLLQLGVLRQRKRWASITAQQYAIPEESLESIIGSLPFSLTSSQKMVVEEIRKDLISGHPMNRLLQGDVGSGKTVVAALTMAIMAFNQSQSALMAPTSILAEQHYRSLLHLLSSAEDTARYSLQSDEIRLLTGNTSETERADILAQLASGKIKILVGTHALIENPVAFQNLQLVIVDEQHRFGVNQRSVLRSKGKNPHLLVMTATPIPRSLALTVYGDLDISILNEMPAGRIPIDTHVIHPADRLRAYHLIEAEIEKGHQAFIVYPLVEAGDDTQDENRAAVEEQQRLQKEIFPHLSIGLLHGRMSGDEKERVMQEFGNRHYQILVSTSVVEVGVDIPNATVMLIEGANRFGLAQLHQFRGRVGRGVSKSYCLLIPENENALENERLAVMITTNDGFILAEKDLEQRGPGDFLGTRQSGFADLQMASITDVILIEKARKQAQRLSEQDPNLSASEYQPLREALRRFWGDGRGDIS